MSTNFVEHFGRGVGDHVTLHLYSPEQVDAFDDGVPAGPTVEATIVGVIRSPWFLDSSGASHGGVFPSPGLYAEFAPNFLGATGVGNINALVKLHDRSEQGIQAFEDEFTRVTGIENIEEVDLLSVANHARNVVRFETRALLLLAAAAAAASALMIGLAISRFCSVSFENLDVLRAFGLTPRQTRFAVAVAPATVGIAGALLGAAVAGFASQWFPIGSASLIEPTPGIDVDVLVLVGVIAAMLVLVVGVSVWSVRASRRLTGDTAAVAGTLVGKLTAGWPLRAAMGTRLALEGGNRRNATNGRAALAAGMLGVTGVVAALMFSTGIADATDGYERFGQTFELASFYGAGGEDFVDATSALTALAADPDVDGTNDAYNDVASSAGGPVSLFSYDAVGDPIDVVVTEGRLPLTESEIALAPDSADADGVRVGDTITLTGPVGTIQLTVSGLAFVPAGPHNSYSSGGWILPAAFDTLFDGFRFHFGLASTVPGADSQAVIDRLAAEGVMVEQGPIIPPTERDELRQLQTVPLLLAGFLAVLGLGAIAHTLTSTARRRRHDFAMLRALGMRPRDTTAVVFVQAAVIAIASLAVGVPAGILVGRALWRGVALDTPVQFVVPDAWAMLAFVCTIVIVVALLLALWPSRRLATVRLGDVLRDE